MPKESRRSIALHMKLAAMQSAVVGFADRHQVLGMVPAAVGSQLGVVQIEEGSTPTTWHATALVVAPQHASANRRRDVLLCASTYVCAFSNAADLAARDGSAHRRVVGRLNVDPPQMQRFMRSHPIIRLPQSLRCSWPARGDANMSISELHMDAQSAISVHDRVCADRIGDGALAVP